MSKRILSLDLGITSVGYSILDEIDKDRYKLIDYGVSMFDNPTNKDGKSKKLLHSIFKSASNLVKLRKKRVKNIAKIFEKYKLANYQELIKQEKENRYKNKWELRAKKAFEQKLTINELFTILYHIAKHRGYKSLDTDDLLEELLEELNLQNNNIKKPKDSDEKGKIKKALKRVEELHQKYPNKTVASLIYEIELSKPNPTLRNHDNYNYMIRREYIRDEIKKIILVQEEFGLLKGLNIDNFISDIIETIDDQKEPTNDLSLFSDCEFYKEYKVAHQYSLLSDIFKMYQNVSNIKLNSQKITKEQIAQIEKEFFKRIEKGKNISDIKYSDVRKILKLPSDVKIFNKEDYYVDKKGNKINYTITKFHFLPNLSSIGNSFIINALKYDNYLDIFDEIFTVIKEEKTPKIQYEKLDKIFNKYKLSSNEEEQKETIFNLIKNKSGKSLNLSHYAMKKFIPLFKEGLTLDDIKQKLNLGNKEDYSSYKKGIKYLNLKQYESDDNLKINNHVVKYVVSATLRVIKHLHALYGPFDEIRVESTRELSLNEEAKKAIEKANKEQEKRFNEIISNKEYQKIAKSYNKNLKKYANKIMLWEEQDKLDIYHGKTIGMDDIFSNKVDIDHIIPQSLGGLSVKHNLVLAHRAENIKKSNRLPMDFVENKEDFKNRVEYLFKEHKINWKKRKNLLATSLDECYKDIFESKSLRATSYIEALTAKTLKRYYPFNDKTKQANGQAVVHIQGRATSNIRKLLKIKPKVRDTNIHHAVDAIIIGLTNKSWLQKISNAFRENRGLIDDKARENVKKVLPQIEGVEPKELIELIEDNYNIYGEDSIFYRDIFKNLKSISYWVSKKPASSKIHRDTIYSKKANGIFTIRTDIQKAFIALEIKATTKPEDFTKKFTKDILEKMYLYKINPKDAIVEVVQSRANEIKELLERFTQIDKKNKEQLELANKELDEIIHKPLIDNNGNVIRRVKFYQSNLTGFNIRGGLALTDKSFIGFKATLNGNKISYERVDMSNYNKLKRENDSSFKVFKNDIVFFIFKDGSFKGGKIVSFLEEGKLASFQNPRYPSAIKYQPESFCIIGKDKEGNPKKASSKQHRLGKAIGIIRLNLDILGNLKSYNKFGEVSKEVEDKILLKE